jgi:hypothetical protein
MAASGASHAGIAFAPQGAPIGTIISGLLLIGSVVSAEEMVGSVEFI